MIALCRYGLPVALAALVIAEAQPAEACGPIPCAQRNDVQPEDGSVGLPLNTEIRVLYFGSIDAYAEAPCELDLTRVRLAPRNGSALELQGEWLERPQAREAWLVAKPAEPLLANTEYDIQLELAEGVSACSCDEREWTTVATFATGTDSDHGAPGFSGLDAMTYGDLLEGNSTCGLSRVIPVTPALDAAQDASPGTRYNVYVDGIIEKRYVEDLTGSGMSPEVYVDCGSSALSTFTRVTPGVAIEARAVDIAGNESAANTPIEVTARCEPPANAPETDPETAPEPEPAPEADDGISRPTALMPVARRENPGCAVSPTSSPSSGLALWTLLLVLIGVRRWKPAR